MPLAKIVLFRKFSIKSLGLESKLEIRNSKLYYFSLLFLLFKYYCICGGWPSGVLRRQAVNLCIPLFESESSCYLNTSSFVFAGTSPSLARHRILTPTIEGSNPSVPASSKESWLKLFCSVGAPFGVPAFLLLNNKKVWEFICSKKPFNVVLIYIK